MTVHARIGVPGSLVEIPGVSGLSHAPERLTSRRVTLGGRRVTQEAAQEHRTWSVELRPGSAARDVANLAALAAGEWGRGPFAFVSEWAQVTNVLTPRASALDVGQSPAGVMVAGPVQLEDGAWAGRHLSISAPVNLPRVGGVELPLAVLGAGPLCVSLYTTGGFRMRVRYLDASRTQTWHSPSLVVPTSPMPRRAHIAGPVPSGAAWALVVIDQLTAASAIVARPAATWTDVPLPWFPGQGVNTVTLEGLSTEVLQAWAAEGGQRAGFSFDVVEVG